MDRKASDSRHSFLASTCRSSSRISSQSSESCIIIHLTLFTPFIDRRSTLHSSAVLKSVRRSEKRDPHTSTPSADQHSHDVLCFHVRKRGKEIPAERKGRTTTSPEPVTQKEGKGKPSGSGGGEHVHRGNSNRHTGSQSARYSRQKMQATDEVAERMRKCGHNDI